MEQSKINLEEIKNISDNEFKNLLIEWIEDRGVSKELQCKMRKDLFHSFNRTNLGRFISSQPAHRIVLSPLILAINTLVAEFLYSQNCHFSLSVFSAEVPFKNTLPNFENTDNFKFSQIELKDIYEAIGIKNSTEISNKITNLYNSNGSAAAATTDECSPKINASLLYAIFNIIFNSKFENKQFQKIYNSNTNTNNNNNIKINNNNANLSDSDKSTKNKIINKNNDQQNCVKCLQAQKTIRNYERNPKYFKYLNKYLQLLSLRVKEMSECMIKLKKSKQYEKCTKNNTLNSEKLDNINKSLEKLSENMKLINQSNKTGKDIAQIVKCIDRLTGTLEKCTEHFQEFSSYMEEQQQQQQQQQQIERTKQLNTDEEVDVDFKNNKNKQQTYSEWITELKSSKYGQTFIKHLETSLTKTFDNEKEKLINIFDEKLENHRQIIRLHYKQKLLEKFNVRQTDDTNEQLLKQQHEHFEDFGKKLQEYDDKINKHIIVSKQIEDDHAIKQQNVKSPLLIEKISQNTDVTRKENLTLNEINIKSRTPSPQLNYFKAFNIDIEPVVCQSKDDNHNTNKINKIKQQYEQQQFNHIVYDAKLRLQQLENESEKLDKSFQMYLRKQYEDKQKINVDVQKILQNYNFGKNILNKTLHNFNQQQKQLGINKLKPLTNKCLNDNSFLSIQLTDEQLQQQSNNHKILIQKTSPNNEGDKENISNHKISKQKSLPELSKKEIINNNNNNNMESGDTNLVEAIHMPVKDKVNDTPLNLKNNSKMMLLVDHNSVVKHESNKMEQNINEKNQGIEELYRNPALSHTGSEEEL